jgi:16S rRNA (guanine527-N7)-methyltransferase
MSTPLGSARGHRTLDTVSPERSRGVGPDEFQQIATSIGIKITDQMMDRLRLYERLLTDWQTRMNLVGPATLPDIWNRHFLDSAQLLSLSGAAGLSGHWLDMGAGGGFPGLVLAALGVERLTLVDSTTKKCQFLIAAAEAMGVAAQVSVQNARIESLSPLSTDYITARACAPLDQLLEWGYRFSHQATRWLLLKGQDVEAELTLAAKSWILSPILHVSQSDSRGRIVDLSHVARLKPPKDANHDRRQNSRSAPPRRRRS